MKKILSLVAFFCLSTATFAQDSGPSKIEGFRTFEWGQKIDEMTMEAETPNFIPTEKLKDGSYYILANEDLIIGNVLLSSINYVFSKKDDKFYKVILTGKKEDVEQMRFIVEYKYGKHQNETQKDDYTTKQWIIQNVSISLIDYEFKKFELIIESDWEAAEAFKKNTNVTDF